MGRISRVLSMSVLVMIITTTVFTGCGKKDRETSNNVMGRYMESEVELPVGVENNNISKMEKSEDGLPIIYVTTQEEGIVSINIYEMKKSGEWAKESPEWLQKISLQEEDKFANPRISVNTFFTDNEGNQYLYYDQVDNNIVMAYLCMTKDGKERTYLTFNEWNEAEEDGNLTYYNAPNNIIVLKSGDILAQFGTDIVVYDKQSKKEKASFSSESYDLSSAVVTDKNVFMIQRNYETNYISGVISIDTEDYGENIQTYPYDGRIECYWPKLRANEDGDIILSDTEGIHVLTAGASLWNTVVIGELNTMYMPTATITDMYQDKDANYYVLYSVEGTGYVLAKYQYDKEIVAVPDKEITVYILKNDMVLREAAVAFNKEHPDVIVTVEVAMDLNSSATIQDCIKALNTRLLADSGPDILVTDGLPVGSYINKSVLLDIKDTVEPMIDSGELLSTIMDSYDTNGYMYTIPTRIEPYIMIGRAETVDIAKSFDGLVESSKQTWERSLIGEITPQDLIINYLPTELNTIILEEDGKIIVDNNKLEKFLSKAYTLYNNIDGVTEYTNDGMGDVFSLSYSMQTTLTSMSGFYDMASNTTVKNSIKNGSIQSYGNSYKGVSEIGINANTKYPDIAKKFILSLLSEEIQNKDFSTGIPVNNKSIDDFVEKERNISSYMGGQNDIGESVVFEVPWPSKDDREQIAQICRSVNKRVIIDKKVIDIVAGQFSEAIENGITMENCIEKISNELKLYLSE